MLGSLSYHAVLERGYVLVRDAAGLPVRRAAEAAAAARLSLQFSDGTVAAVPEGGLEPDPTTRTGRQAGPRPSARSAERRSAKPAQPAAGQRSLFDA